MIQNALLLADLEDVLRFIVPVIFVVIWVVSQVMRAGSAQRSQGTPSDESEEYEDWYEEAEAGEKETPTQLSNEIESFLRKVRGEAPKSPPVRQRVPELRPVPERTVVASVPIEATPVEASLVEATAMSTDAYEAVSDRFSAQAARLGADVGHADERVEEHLHEAFDHTLGSLADTSMGADASKGSDGVSPYDGTEDLAVPSTASEFRDLLGTPESIRKAVVLNEILTRPADRW